MNDEMFMLEFGKRKEGVVYEEREGSYGIVIQGESVLLEKARLGYFLPGGGIEAGESKEEALAREFLEETGYELFQRDFLGTASEYVFLKNSPVKKVQYFYIVSLGRHSVPTYPDGHKYLVEMVPINEIKEKMFLKSQWWAIERVLKQGINLDKTIISIGGRM